MDQFVHLHLHTEYSIKDSVLRIPILLEKAKALQFTAMAISDANNLFATIKFYTEAIKHGIKPIIGCELSITDADATAPIDDQCVALCLNEVGYRNLTQLVSIAYLENHNNREPAVRRQDLERYNEGLLILSGALRGALARALLQDETQRVAQLIEFWSSVFKERFYIELQYTQHTNEAAYIARAIKLAKASGLPVVASNDVCFLNQADFDSHEIRVCIAEGRTLNASHRRAIYSPEQYLKSASEMSTLFREIPSAIRNSVEIAHRCTVEIELDQTHMPSFPMTGEMSAKDKLIDDARTGLKNYLNGRADLDHEAYTQRLETELKVISKMGYEGYFLIVADFILWAKDNAIPVGPGRGSGAGSLVAYVLGITEIDPLQYGLFFERFLNPERVSLPDFDVDFCIEGRDRVIQYVMDRYGRDNVSQIITFGSLGAKAAVRDVTRVLGYPYGLGDDIVKLIPARLDIKLQEALNDSAELKERYDEDARVRKICDQALDLEGLVRNVSQHAGGIVIAPLPLTNYTALHKDTDSDKAATHFDMKDIEKVGLLKFDFLGLKTLTIISKTIANVRRRGEAIPDPIDIPRDDPNTYRLLQSGNTTALFQLESDGMRRLIKKLKPDRFADIVALVALYRPGPLNSGMCDEYVERKHGQAFNYQHPILEPILKATHGVILYQEQVMQIAQVLSGYTLGAADILRRAMGKKIAREMADQRSAFISGAISNGVERNTAAQLFDLIEYFAGYGFNKAHSVAYALIAYQTAWLKSNHSGSFMAAVLSSEIPNTDKIINLLDECRGLGLTIVAPDINRAGYEFIEIEQGKILYGLGGIRQVGHEVIKTLVDERVARGPYRSLSDFCKRLVPHIRNNIVESLLAAGAFDLIEPDRGRALHSLADIYTLAEQASRDRHSGQTSLFGGEQDTQISLGAPNQSDPLMNHEQLLAKEKSSLGFYLSSHPVNAYRDKLKDIVDHQTLRDFRQSVKASSASTSVWLAGTMSQVERKIVYRKSPQKDTPTGEGRASNKARGKSVAFFILDDGTDRFNMSLFDNDYENCKEKLSYEGVVVVGVYKAAYDIQNDNDRWRASRIMTVDEAQREFAKKLNIVWDIGSLGDAYRNDERSGDLVAKLSAALQSHKCSRGGCKVFVIFRNGVAETRMILSKPAKVDPCKQLCDSIKCLPGVLDITVDYKARTG